MFAERTALGTNVNWDKDEFRGSCMIMNNKKKAKMVQGNAMRGNRDFVQAKSCVMMASRWMMDERNISNEV